MNTKQDNQRVIDIEASSFAFRFPYDPSVVDAIKAIEGRRYNPTTKTWKVPLSKAADVAKIASEFSFTLSDSATVGISNPDALRPMVAGDAGVIRATDTFYIKFSYDPAKVEAVKTIYGRRWHPDLKLWTVPLSSIRGVRFFCDKFKITTDALTDVPDSDPVIEPEISQVADGFEIRFPYDRDLVQQVREIPTARFDRKNKVWLVDGIAQEEVAGFAENTSAVLDEVLEIPFADIWERRLRHVMSRATDADIEIPTLHGELKGFQKAGIHFALTSLGYVEQDGMWRRVEEKAKSGVFIGDEQGLGKTVQALGVLEATGAFPAVVVVPTSVRTNWHREAQKWLPHRSAQVVHGVKPTEVTSDIVIIGWDTVHGWSDTIPVTAAVFDEAHYAKNENSRRSKAALALSKRAVAAGGFSVALSGTPLLNHPDELKSQLRMIGRLDEFGGAGGFNARYVRDDGNLPELGKRMRETCFVRRLKADVMPELGDKEYIDLVVEGDEAVMKEYRHIEDEFRKEVGEELEQAISLAEGETEEERLAAGLREFQKIGTTHLVRLERLRQLAAEAKREAIREWVEDFTGTGKKLVVFGWHRDDVDWVADTFGDGLKIQGGMKDSDKQEAVDRFQTSDDVSVISCSLKAAGVGLTLTAASDVLFIEQGWNPADMDQAADRCHRIGQKDSVTVYTMLCAGTIDERIAQLIDAKRQVVDAVMEGGEVDDIGGIAMSVLAQFAREGLRESSRK